MRVVSNTSPILNLALVGRLDLLHELFGPVLVPAAVAQELSALELRLPVLAGVLRPAWIRVESTVGAASVVALESELHAGEAEAIALAMETSADLLLLDERMGRRVAAGLGLAVGGLLGVLLTAKRRGLLPAVRPVLDEVIAQAGFWVDATLYARVLREAGEAGP